MKFYDSVICATLCSVSHIFNSYASTNGTLYINPCGVDLIVGGSVSYVTHPGKVLGRCALLCEEEDHCIGYSMPQCSLLQSIGNRCEEIGNSTEREILVKQDMVVCITYT